jgi:hypothetical protein
MDDKFRKKWIEDWIDQNSGGALKINEGDLVRSAKELNLILVTTDRKMKRIKDADPSIQIHNIA